MPKKTTAVSSAARPSSARHRRRSSQDSFDRLDVAADRQHARRPPRQRPAADQRRVVGVDVADHVRAAEHHGRPHPPPRPHRAELVQRHDRPHPAPPKQPRQRVEQQASARPHAGILDVNDVAPGTHRHQVVSPRPTPIGHAAADDERPILVRRVAVVGGGQDRHVRARRRQVARELVRVVAHARQERREVGRHQQHAQASLAHRNSSNVSGRGHSAARRAQTNSSSVQNCAWAIVDSTNP